MLYAVKGESVFAIKHRAFAMILAIFVVVLVALGGVILLGNASIGGKSVGDNYLRAQAELLAISATEFAVMRAQDFDTSGANCLTEINIDVQDASGAHSYDVNVSLSYSFKNAAPVSCVNAGANLSDLTGNESMILVDTTVSTNLSTEPIRVHKRSWQKL